MIEMLKHITRIFLIRIDHNSDLSDEYVEGFLNYLASLKGILGFQNLDARSMYLIMGLMNVSDEKMMNYYMAYDNLKRRKGGCNEPERS